jgi:hypothetical protein
MSVTRTKRCDPCGTRATSNRSRYCTNCTQYFRPRGVSDFDWLFWTEINKAVRHNVSLSQELQDSVIHGADINEFHVTSPPRVVILSVVLMTLPSKSLPWQ